MHTTFRVYGSAIGRTALGCRTVGRGFKNVSRMKGGYIDAEGSEAYTDDTWNTERDIGDYIDVQPSMYVNPLNIRFHEQDEDARQHQENVKRMNRMIAMDDIKKLKKEVEKTIIPEIKVDETVEQLLKQFEQIKKSNNSEETKEEQSEKLIDKIDAQIEKTTDPEKVDELKKVKAAIEDEGYIGNTSLAVIEKIQSKIVWNDEIINEKMDGVFEAGDMFKTEEVVKGTAFIRKIMNEKRLDDLYKSDPNLEGMKGTYREKDKEGNYTGPIVECKGFELSLCANDDVAHDALKGTYTNTNFKSMDSICKRDGIASSSSQPFDSYNEDTDDFLEFKYYKNKYNFMRGVNANKLMMKDHYQELKTDLSIAYEENNTTEILRLKDILKDAESFEINFLQNRDYVSVNIINNKLPKIGNAISKENGGANSQKNLENFSRKENKLMDVEFDNENYITSIKPRTGKLESKNRGTEAYKKLIKKRAGLGFAICFDDALATYSLTKDPLLQGKNIYNIFQIRPASDAQSSDKLMNALALPLHRMVMSHPKNTQSEIQRDTYIKQIEALHKRISKADIGKLIEKAKEKKSTTLKPKPKEKKSVTLKQKPKPAIKPKKPLIKNEIYIESESGDD